MFLSFFFFFFVSFFLFFLCFSWLFFFYCSLFGGLFPLVPGASVRGVVGGLLKGREVEGGGNVCV